MVAGPAVQAILSGLQIVTEQATPQGASGKVAFGVVEQLGFLDLNLIPPNDPRDFVLTFQEEAGTRVGFRVAVSLNEGPQKPLFELVSSVPGKVLTAAQIAPDGETLTPLAGVTTQLLGANAFLVIQGRVSGAVEIRLSPSSALPDDVLILTLDPQAALLGSSGFGFAFPDGLALDLSDTAKANGPTVIDGTSIVTPADTPAWRGIVVRNAKFFLPQGVPFLGGHAVNAHVQVGLAPTPGIDLVLHTTIPAQGERPAIGVRIECRDPTATGIAGFVPTLVEMTMDLPLNGREESFPGGAFTLGAGKPVRMRATYARKPAGAGAPDTADLGIAIESQGPAGIVRIDSSDGNLGAKIAVTFATLATSLIAGSDAEPAPDGDGSGVWLHNILAVAVGLSSFLESGQVVVHGAEFITTGGVLPAGKLLRLKIDYSVAATVTGINVGVMSLQMQPNQPLRVRVREVVLTIDPSASGLAMIHLDYTKSSLEVEDPGGWKVQGPGSLFDVLGTRSGRGSLWIEVDLRFKLDLGPVRVSGVTIRATLDAQGKLSASMRGLEASIALQPMIDGSGAVHLSDNGWSATLRANIKPLNDLGARADVEQLADMVKLALGVDLPGPIPLGNSGLGIYGLGGVFAANGKPAPVPPGKDPVEHQLQWDYRNSGSFVPAEAFSFGLEAVIGTAVDMGYTFSARTGIFITTPEFALRGALNGKFMGERVKITREDEGGPGIQAKGVIVVDPSDGVTIGIEGTYKIPEILEIIVPIGARFPKASSDWYIHLGADGWSPPPGGKTEGRERGPIRASLLPNLINQQADAYIMFRGSGITSWPRGGPKSVAKDTFIAALGFGFDIVMGVRPVVWADVFARADILISTNPMTLVGLGQVGGGLHVGPFSVGVDAGVHVVVVEGEVPYLFAEVCGKVDLVLDTVRKCVKLSFNSVPAAALPPPAHPLDSARGQSLVDDHYRVIAPLAPSRDEAAVVWPDAIPLLTFTTAPTLSLASAQFPGATPYPQSVRARPLGGDLLEYEWELIDLMLVDATDPANELLVAGPMSCAWLDGKFGDAGAQAQPAELALLTPFGDLWLNALGDAGASLPHEPLDARANICQLRVAALSGWALGAAATAQQSGWRLPPDPLSSDPLQSQPRATVELFVEGAGIDGGRMPLDADTAALLPSPFGFVQPLVHKFADVDLDDRTFNACLDCGAVLVPPETPLAVDERTMVHELRIVADEPLTRAKLWLVADRTHWVDLATGMNRVKVVDDGGQSWAADAERDLGNGSVAIRWQRSGGAAVSVMTVRASAAMPIGVIALGGITATAEQAAASRNATMQAEAEKLKQAAQAGPPPATASPTSNTRCVLKAGKTYRLDVTMRWSGKLWQIDEKGNKVPLAPPQPADGSTDALRSYWFKTAKLGNSTSLGPGTAAFVEYTYKKRDLFDPDMLVRHLRGYEPAQSELHRFANDPVRVHFAHGHVAALAGVYGFNLDCGLRRLDVDEDVEADQFVSPILLAPQSSLLMTGPDKVITEAYLASQCVLPVPGVILDAAVSLSRNVWYEVFVRARSLTPATVADGRIPGVSFRTSRWGGGEEMMTSLQFPTSGSGNAHGGAMIRAGATLSAKSVMDDDAAFDAMLADLGLDGWPAATEPRISLLWRETAGQWRCAGVLLESPEPIHRPGRFLVNGLQLRMGPTAMTFDIRMRDRSGSRLLFATTAPFLPRKSRQFFLQPPRPPMLGLDCTDLPIGKPSQSLLGWLDVPLRPSFAEEAA